MGLVVGTAGHIDHGKTTLVRALTGIDTDRLKEEKKRGLSIDLGFAYMELEGRLISFVDVPGHERFIRNMLAGAGGLDCVLFCVACDDGIMPQTIEHLDIVHILGIKRGAFVLTKVDTVDGAKVARLGREVEELAKGTTLEGLPVVAVSAHTGEGMEELKAILRRLCVEEKERPAGGPTRLPIDRVFPVKGFGCVATGTLIEGTIRKGASLKLFPSGKDVRVRGLQSHHHELEQAGPHSRVAVNLSGLSHRECRRGDMLVDGTLWKGMQGVVAFDCVLELSRFADRPLKNNSYLKLYCFTTEATVRVRLADRESLAAGSRAVARIFSRVALPLLGGDRFVLRDPSVGQTIGGGRVVVSYPARRLLTPIRDIDRDALERMDVARITSYLLKRRPHGLDLKTLGFMLNLEWEGLVRSIEGAAEVELLEGWVFPKGRLDALKEGVLSLLSNYHRRYPERRGIHREELSDRVGLPQELKEPLFRVLVEAGQIRLDGARVSLSSHRPALKGKHRDIADWLLKMVEDGVSAIRLDAINRGPYRKEDVEVVLRHLVEDGRLVKLKEGLYMKQSTIDMALDRLKCYIKEKGSIRAGEFRDLLCCGRRLAIEMLEYFDRRGITQREGDERRLC